MNTEGLTTALAPLATEEGHLQLIVTGKHTCAGDTTQDIGAGTLEERPPALLGQDDGEGMQRAAVLDGLTGGHHHTTTNGIDRVRGKTSTDSDTPAKEEAERVSNQNDVHVKKKKNTSLHIAEETDQQLTKR
jgi:hypothetical protein